MVVEAMCCLARVKYGLEIERLKLTKMIAPVQQAAFALSVPFGLSDFVVSTFEELRSEQRARCAACKNYAAFILGPHAGKWSQQKLSWCVLDIHKKVRSSGCCDHWEA